MTILESFDFSALRDLLGTVGADGWLLYDFRGINPTATRVLGINGMGTRRFFVLLPRTGKPVAIAHRIEMTSFAGFPGDVRPYASWRELHEQLRALVGGKTVAMEVSPGDAVPYLDRVPHGKTIVMTVLPGQFFPLCQYGKPIPGPQVLLWGTPAERRVRSFQLSRGLCPNLNL